MNGLELAKSYYETYGREMISASFSDIENRIAIGLVGEGSECLGFDDSISLDHDYEPGFCMFLTDEDEAVYGFKLQRAYNTLPKEFNGFKRNLVNPVGGARHGVFSISGFYSKYLGYNNVPDTIEKWLYTPPSMFLNVTNGNVFRDDLGEFSKIRNAISQGYPEDIRLKKIAANTIFAAQSGQYNYARLLKRQDVGGCILCLNEFVKRIISIVYLLNNKYEPFYKWAFRGLMELKILNNIGNDLLALDYSIISKDENYNLNLIEEISSKVINEFNNQKITNATCNNLDTHAYSITDHIKNIDLRNASIMTGA